jgi:hypothetical protein
MIERLRAVIARVEQLPEEQQEALAALWERQIEEQLEEAKWEASFADPRSLTVLDALVQRAKEQVARGEVYDTLRDPE